ncbi:MAG: glycosyltransferase family 2 protein [Dehalococcoidia bacterium]|jgi:glycosyltransferase involved in cell wall biosynthesis
MGHPKILAAITAYNSANFIEKTLISLLNQDYPALRRTVIDDCSSDRTYEIISKYTDKIEVVRNELNSGFSFSLNRALAMVDDEDYLFILQDDVELVDTSYITKLLEHAKDDKIAIVCGQAIFQKDQGLSLVKKSFARYEGHDYQDEGLTKISYSLLKADLIKIDGLRHVGGFGFAGNPKLGVEDQVLAKALRSSGYILLKDATIAYRLDYARSETLSDFLKVESNFGKTLAVAVVQGLISVNPSDSTGNRNKSNYRRTQVVIVSLICASILLFAYSYILAIAVILGLLSFEFINYMRKSAGFNGVDKLRFAAIGLLIDFAFSISFYWGMVLGLKERFLKSKINSSLDRW